MRSRKKADKDTRRQRVRQNAQESKKGGQTAYFVAKDVGILPSWTPKKAGTHFLDIVPYVVDTEGHPDDVPVGEVWWKLPFGIHTNMGLDNERVVCPRSVGVGNCPICEEYKRLAKDWEENQEICKAIKLRHWVAMNMLDPDDASSVVIFCMSHYNFMEQLRVELEDDENEKHSLFFDLDEEGRTLKVRFEDASVAGGVTYQKASRIDFKPRKAADDAAVTKLMAKVWDLQSVLVVRGYNDLKALYEGQIAADASDRSEGAGRPDEDDGGDDDVAPSTFPPDDDDNPDEDKDKDKDSPF